MRTNKALCIIATAFILFGCILYMIEGLDAINTLRSTLSGYNINRAPIDKLISISTFQVIIAIVVMIIAFIGIFVAASAQSNSKRTAVISLCFVILCFEKIYSIFALRNYYIEYIDKNYSLDGWSVFGLILLFGAIFLFLACLGLIGDGKERSLFNTGLIACIFISVVFIITLSTLVSATFTSIMYCLLIIAAAVITSVAYFQARNNNSTPVVVKTTPSQFHYDPTSYENFGPSTSQPQSKPVEPVVKPAPVVDSTPKPVKNELDPVDELLKLKKLFDAGAITQEEYEDKRKKYVDKL